MSLDDQIITFMTNMSASLGRIEEAVENTKKDIDEVKSACSKIPTIENGLNNHLRTHDRIKIRFFYPLSVAIVAAIIITLLKEFHIL